MTLEQVIQKLDRLQANNDNSTYMLEVAKYCKDDKFIKIFEHICALHELDNFLISHLGKYRDFQFERLKEGYSETLKPLGIFPMNQYEDDEIPF